MKRLLAVIVAASFALGPDAAPVAAFPAEGAVTSLSVVPASGRAELVIGFPGAVEVADITLRSPDRIVLDITGASLGIGSRGYDHVARGAITDIRVSQYRKNTVRVVINLDGPRSYEVIKEGVHLTEGNEGNWGSQAVDLAPAQGAIVEMRFDEDGLYPIVTHAFNFVGRGALGMFQAGDGGPAVPSGH